MPTTVELHDTKFERIGEGVLDERKRLALAKAVEHLRRVFGDVSRLRFTVLTNKAGYILLVPETPVPLHEAWIYKNPARLASVMEGIKQAEEGGLNDLGSFARYADDEID